LSGSKARGGVARTSAVDSASRDQFQRIERDDRTGEAFRRQMRFAALDMAADLIRLTSTRILLGPVDPNALEPPCRSSILT
jgi:hypothetical protein